MSSFSSVGVNAFRPSFQIATQQLSRRTPFTARYFSSCRSSITVIRKSQRHQWQQWGSNSNTTPSTVLRHHARGTPSPSQPTGVRAASFLGHRVIINYVDIPPNYTDEVGLPFARHDLTAEEVLRIFGPGIGTLAANKLLKILHGRRVAGTLEDPEFQVHTAHYSKKDRRIALEYLRKHVTVDEIANAGLRAEDELAALEGHDVGEDGLGRKSNEDLGYTSPYLFKKEKTETEDKPNVYGVGVFEKIRAKNKAKFEAEAKRKEEERRKRDEEAVLANPGTLQMVDGKLVREVSPWIKKYQEEASSDLQAPPEMKKWERILPSAVFALLLTAGFVAYAQFYQSPGDGDRLLPFLSPSQATFAVIVAANLLVWGAWKIPPMWKYMNQYFLLVAATPRAVSLLGALFSHQSFFHLAGNLLLCYFIAVPYHDEVGRGNFLATYFAAGTLGYLASLTTFVLKNQLYQTTLGASGGIYGIVAAYFWMHRFEGFKVFNLPPDPYNGIQGLGFLGLFVGVNIAHIFASKKVWDLGSHFGGMAMGILAGHLLESKANEKLKKEEASESAGTKEASKKLLHGVITQTNTK
ncbi:hypothetical protein B0H63DRAFT_461925 [Podospora didyma]|uniref:Peptidase S54 rhomboid domain-containing protein n=1 Tax=Podospora didyma TaxID=330526 RepID=A0AAE0U8V0_9PEZI|nr:hypothetical protein B0H63DRAFT_461925 [Podospora didyma]